MQQPLLHSICIICHQELGAYAIGFSCRCIECKFCSQCLEEYLNNKYTNCPICKKQILEHEEQNTTNIIVILDVRQQMQHQQQSEITELDIFCSVQTSKYLYYINILYAVIMAYIGFYSQLCILEIMYTCLGVFITMLIIRRYITGFWYVEINGDIVMERQSGIRVNPFILRYTYIFDFVSFLSAIPFQIFIQGSFGFMAFTCLQTLQTIIVFSLSAYYTSCGQM